MRVTAVIAFGLEGPKKEVWSTLEPLLLADDEDIRRLVCYYATQTLTRSEVQALLKRYLQRATYYYNVVALLDRAAYFPARYLPGLLEEQRAFFQEATARAQTNSTSFGMDLPGLNK